MEDQETKTVEELVKRLRDRVASYSVAIIDLEVMLEVEQQKTAELEAELAELKASQAKTKTTSEK